MNDAARLDAIRDLLRSFTSYGHPDAYGIEVYDHFLDMRFFDLLVEALDGGAKEAE